MDSDDVDVEDGPPLPSARWKGKGRQTSTQRKNRGSRGGGKVAEEDSGNDKRAKNYTSVEYLLLSKAFMRNSLDAVRGTNKKSHKMWQEIHGDFDTMRLQNNLIYHKSQPDVYP